MIKSIILSITLAGCMAMPARAAYTGHVFIDKNKNGLFDKGEQTLPGVMVSDGLNVVKTSRDGSFSLPGHEKERFIFITTPSGYKTNNAYYQRIEAGKETYDFGVTAYDAPIGKGGDHRFIHISDTEIHGSRSNAEHSDWTQNLREYAANERVAFIMHGGDICYENGLKNHIHLMNTENMGVPVFYSIGNHDLVKGAYGEELFEKIYGPVCYSFDVGSVHYVVTPMMGGDYRPSYRPAEVYEWLKNDLAQIPSGKPVILFGHDLSVTGDTFVLKLKDGQLNLDSYNLKAWLYGHWHISHVYKHKKAYSICSLTPIRGGIDHSPASYRVMNIDAQGNFSSELRYPYIRTLQIASIDNLKACYTPSGNVQLAVNVYSAVSPVKQISYECRAMGRKLNSGKLLQRTDFAWAAEVPLAKDLSGELVGIRIKAEFNNGEILCSERSFIHNPSSEKVQAQEDWTNLLGNPQHTGISRDSTPASFRPVWVQNVGSNIYMSSPVVYRGNIYAASVDENGKGQASITCMASDDGRVLWKYPTRNSVKNTTVASDGLILAQDVEGNFYAIDAHAGKLAWERKLTIDPVLPTLIEGIVVKDGIVYAGAGKGLCAIDVKSGEELWHNQGWRQNQGSTATMSLDNGVLISSAHWGALFGNDALTGEKLWQVEKDGIRHRSSSAVMQGDVFYLASDHSLFLMETKTGRILTQKQLPFSVNVASSPLVTDKEIIFGTAAEGIVALNRDTWEEKWRYRTGEDLIYTAPYFRNPSSTVEVSPVLMGNMVVVGGADGVLYGLDKESGAVLWRHATGAPVLAAVSVSGNMMFAADYGGNVYAFEAVSTTH